LTIFFPSSVKLAVPATYRCRFPHSLVVAQRIVFAKMSQIMPTCIVPWMGMTINQVTDWDISPEKQSKKLSMLDQKLEYSYYT